METKNENRNSGRTDRSVGRQISYIARTIRWIIDHELAGTGVSSATHQLIRIIHRNPGISQNDLSGRTQIDKATAAKGVAKLETLGYLRREPDTTDRRVRRLYLTEEGESILPVIHTVLRRVTGIAAGDLNESELKELFRLLDRVEETVFRYVAAAREEGHTR